jgi:hypothetical protein
MAEFKFPRDADSRFNHITFQAVSDSVRRLLEGLEQAFVHDDLNVRRWLRGEQGWDVSELLKVGAACAFLKKLDPETDYDAALVHQALSDRLSVDRGIDPESMTSRNYYPPETYTRSPF